MGPGIAQMSFDRYDDPRYFGDWAPSIAPDFGISACPTSYGQVMKLLAALSPSLPGVRWYFKPALSDAFNATWITVHDRPWMLAQHHREPPAGYTLARGYPYGFRAMLVRDPIKPGFRIRQGHCTLTFAPGHGGLQPGVLRPGGACPQRDLATMMKSIPKAVLRQASATFVLLDVKQAQGPLRRPGADLYRVHFLTAPDRARHRLNGLSAPGARGSRCPSGHQRYLFSGETRQPVGGRAIRPQPQHIEQMQQVERRQAKFDALPMIHPSFS